MDIRRDYKRCHVNGDGVLYLNENEKVEFNIIDLSASGMRAKIDIKIDLGSLVNIEFHVNNYLFNKKIKTSAKVLSEYDKENNIYGLRFVELDEFSKIEIDEIMKNKCDVSKINNTRNCEDGHCVFFNSKK